MVTFSYLNLMEETYPSLLSNTNAMDYKFLPQCPHVLRLRTAKEVVRKLRRSLLDGGWLIVSPCETSHILYEQFTTVNFPGTILYQKDNHSSEISAFSFEAQTQSPLEAMPPFSLCVTPEPAILTVEPQEEAIAFDIIEIKETPRDETAYGKSLLLYEQGCYEEAALIFAPLGPGPERRQGRFIVGAYLCQPRKTCRSKPRRRASRSRRQVESFLSRSAGHHPARARRCPRSHASTAARCLSRAQSRLCPLYARQSRATPGEGLGGKQALRQCSHATKRIVSGAIAARV